MKQENKLQASEFQIEKWEKNPTIKRIKFQSEKEKEIKSEL